MNTHDRVRIEKSAAPKKVTRLEDLLVKEVSIVDRPANQRPFLVVKAEKGPEIPVAADGTLGAPPTTTTPVVEEDVSKKLVAAAEAISKQLTIDPQTRKLVFQALGDAMDRIRSVCGTADAATTDWTGESQSTLTPVLGAELTEVAAMIAELGTKLSAAPAAKADVAKVQAMLTTFVAGLEESVEKRGAKMAKDRLTRFKASIDSLAKLLSELEAQQAEAQKAVWTTAQVDALPDSAFLYVKPGGKKDGAGKTVPRSNRMFPVKGPDGAVDMPHLRNALARIPQSNLPPDVKTKLTAAAQGMMPKGGAAKTKTKKSEDEEIAKAFGVFNARVDALAATVRKNDAAARALPIASNSIPIDAGHGAPSEPETSWPLDLNNERTRDTVDKSVSFLDS